MSTPTTDQSNAIVNETSVHDFMRTFIDYLDDGIHLPALLQVRQLDISLQDCYRRARTSIENLRTQTTSQQEDSTSHALIINALEQAKSIGDKKLQLTQQIFNTVEQQSRQLKLAYKKCIESNNVQNSQSDNIPQDFYSENECDSESGSYNPLSTANSRRKLLINSEQNEKSNNNEREKRKLVQRNLYSNNGNGKRLRMNNNSTTTKSDEAIYCLCSQHSYGSMILCDSKTCEIKWFHFNCVNLTTKPKGKWFCPNCRESRP